MAVNEWGHAVLCAVLSVVDDTALVLKSVVSELKVRGSVRVFIDAMKRAHAIMHVLFFPVKTILSTGGLMLLKEG